MTAYRVIEKDSHFYNQIGTLIGSRKTEEGSPLLILKFGKETEGFSKTKIKQCIKG